MHVGITPLPHGAWEYGKSGYKLVQYMAASTGHRLRLG
jgi:hypothetical protein